MVHHTHPPCLPPCTATARSVRDGNGVCLRVFHAHDTGVLAIAQAGTRTYSLAADGSIKGWSSAVPHPSDISAL